MRDLIAGLRNEDVRLIIARATTAEREELLRAFGLHARSTRAAALMRARLRTLTDDEAHLVLDHFVATIIRDATTTAGAEQRVEEVFSTIGERWSARAVRLLIEALWHQEEIPYEQRNALHDSLDAPLDEDLVGHHEPLAPQRTSTPHEQFRIPASPLDALIGQVIRPGSAAVLDADELDGRRLALEELLRLDPERPSSWYFYGVLGAQLAVPLSTQPTVVTCRLAMVLGQLHVAIADGDADTAWRIFDGDGDGDGEDNAALLQQHAGASVTGYVLAAGLRNDKPRRVAQLVTIAARPFAGRDVLLQAVHAATATLMRSDRIDDAEILVQSVEETWWDRAAESNEERFDLQAEVAGLIVLRAALRLRLRDYRTATRLLEELDVDLLDDDLRLAAARTAVLAGLEVASVAAVDFPTTNAQRLQWRERLDPVRDELEVMTSLAGDDPTGPILSGLAALVDGDDAAAVNAFDAAVRVLPAATDIPPRLHAAIRFAHALAELRLLDPSVRDAAYNRALAAVGEDEFHPGADDVVALVDALEAHGALDAAAAFLAHERELVSREHDLRALVARLASSGTDEALVMAESLAATESAPIAERFTLAEAALAGRLHGGDAVDHLVDTLEDLVIQANVPTLDSRWERMLATNDAVRTSVGAVTADTLRLDALRRLGRIDEAIDLTRSLFFRAASGTVEAIDPADMWHVLVELGAPATDLAALERLSTATVQVDAATTADLSPIAVLFVGGDETQARYQQAIEDALRRTHGERVTVQWFLCGWSANWTAHADRIEAAYRHGDAVVIMSFVRTNLGKRIRRTAGEAGLPWVGCTGHGREAIVRAIERAVAAAATAR